MVLSNGDGNPIISYGVECDGFWRMRFRTSGTDISNNSFDLSTIQNTASINTTSFGSTLCPLDCGIVDLLMDATDNNLANCSVGTVALDLTHHHM